MEVHNSILAIFVAAIANYALATLWYAALFGKLWKKLTGINEMKPSPLNMILSFAGALVMSFILFHLVVFTDSYFGIKGVKGGLMAGFHSWLGVVAPVTLMTKIYEKKPWGLWLLDNGFWLLALIVMGTILSLWL